MKDKQFAQLFIDTIHSAEQRCMAADGPVTKTCNEITDDELRTLYEVAQQVTTSPAAPAPAQPTPCKSIHFQQLECVQRLCGKTCFRELNDTVAIPAQPSDVHLQIEAQRLVYLYGHAIANGFAAVKEEEALMHFLRKHLSDAQMQQCVPNGWKIERRTEGPFKRIHLRAPNGYTSVVDSLARNPENILYMLADALLGDAMGKTTGGEGERDER